MSYRTQKNLLNNELVRTGAKPSVLFTRGGKLLANVKPGDLDEVPLSLDVCTPEQASGDVLLVQDGGVYVLDASSVESVRITMPEDHEGVSIAEAWITLGADTAVTLDERITMHDSASELSEGENHIVIQLREDTAVVYTI